MSSLVVDAFGRPGDAISRMSDGNRHANLSQTPEDKVVLAWLSRQCDSERAIDLLNEIEVVTADIPAAAASSLQGRRLLALADCRRLQADISAASDLLGSAHDAFMAAGDETGLGDCAFVKADLSILVGDALGADQLLAVAAQHYKVAGDVDRMLIAIAWRGYQQSYSHGLADLDLWQVMLDEAGQPRSEAAWAYIHAFRGACAFQKGDFPSAIRHWQEGHDRAASAGAIWLAILLATITGAAYANLFDLSMAMEWKEKAYSLAKSTNWPDAMGTALSSMAETVTSLGDYGRSRQLFEESLVHLRRVPESRRHFIAYCAYGKLCSAMQSHAESLVWYEKAGAIAKRLGHPDVERSLSANKSAALVKLGRLDEAEALINGSLAVSGHRGTPYYEVELLHVMASLRRVQDNNDPTRAIPLLEQAMQTAASMDGLIIRTEIYAELARDYEAAGDYRKALHFERCAHESWQRNFDQQNGARILAIQVRHDTAHAKADAEHHRKLAEAEAARAAELDRANQTLERLGSIGQEITARLDSEAVFTTLSRHLHDLMHANTLFVGLKDEASQTIDIRYRMEDGLRLPSRQVALASDNLSARCVRDNEEILVAWGERPYPNSVPGTRHMRTVLFRPLALGDRVLGVVSVQSDQPNAYGPRELLIFRTICAYGAIAMANAEAYQQLDRAMAETREALRRLVQQEKMAALGQLVAGVAHEVNTPLGVTLSAVSQLNDNIRVLRGLVEKGSLTRSVLTESLDNGQELATLAQRNVTRAADMIRTFKGVAVDHGSDERRVFDLDEYLAEVMSLIRARVSGNGNKIELDIKPVQMDTYPGALAQVVTNLVSNVADHAYTPDAPGRIILRGRPLDASTVEIAVIDQGVGIPADILPRVFDPFFTTRRAAGSMGLGLHVAFNQVTQRLNGSIVIDSVPGQGTVATLRIPREVPGTAPAGILPAPL